MFIYDLIHIPTGASLVENFLNQEESHLDSDYYLLYNRDEQPEWSDVAYDTWLLLTSKYVANLAGMACFFSDIFRRPVSISRDWGGVAYETMLTI